MQNAGVVFGTEVPLRISARERQYDEDMGKTASMLHVPEMERLVCGVHGGIICTAAEMSTMLPPPIYRDNAATPPSIGKMLPPHL